MKQPLHAHITEFSDNGGKSWEMGQIHWSIVGLVKDMKELPYPARIRKVIIQDADKLVSNEEIEQAIKEDGILAKLFE